MLREHRKAGTVADFPYPVLWELLPEFTFTPATKVIKPIRMANDLLPSDIVQENISPTNTIVLKSASGVTITEIHSMLETINKDRKKEYTFPIRPAATNSDTSLIIMQTKEEAEVDAIGIIRSFSVGAPTPGNPYYSITITIEKLWR